MTVNKMYFAIVEKKTKTRFYFAGYDSSKRGLCSWSQSKLQAIKIADVNIIQQLRRYLVINSIFDTNVYRFEVIDVNNLY